MYKYITSPRYMSLDLSVAGLGHAILVISVIVGLAAAPQWKDVANALKADGGQFSLDLIPLVAMIVLITLQMVLTKSGGRTSRRKMASLATSAAIEHRTLISQLVKIANVRRVRLKDAAIVDVVEKSLKAILRQVAIELQVDDSEYFEATLLLYQPEDKIEVYARSSQKRATGALVDRDQVIAHHVVLSTEQAAFVADIQRRQFRRFGQAGLSEISRPYRSVMFVPVKFAVNGADKAVGVVTIDSDRPCDFWGTTQIERLFIKIIPFVDLIGMVLRSHREKVDVIHDPKARS